MREQIQEKNHTISFVAGNSRVGTDSSKLSAYRFSGYYLQNPPWISTFCGEAHARIRSL